MEYKDRRRVETFIDSIYQMNFTEKLVSIDRFIEDDYYLGKSTVQGSVIYPVWRKALRTIFEDDSKYLIVLTGAIGTGKTTVAVIALAYVQYVLLCLRSAWGFFSKAETGRMGISFFNLTKSLGDSRGFGKLQAYLLNSAWFKEKSFGVPRMRDGSKYLDFSLFRYVLASPYAKGFGCFVADTKISLLDGREVGIQEIVKEVAEGRILWVYSFDVDKGRVVQGRVEAAGRTAVGVRTVKVVLDNGEEIGCTSDHPFLTMDGVYVEAQDLKEGTSLMSLCRQYDAEGYEQFYAVELERWVYTHRSMAGPIPKEYRVGNSIVRGCVNHKVVRVEEGLRQDVYDLTIEGFHNFALSAGVFVHNTVGEDIVAGLMDEVDSPSESIKQKVRVMKAYEATVRRFESRFVIDGTSLGRLFLVASKQEELSFINTFVVKMKTSPKVLVFDIPLWEAQPKHYFSGQDFIVGVGDAFHQPKIIEVEEVTDYIKNGYEILRVPVEFRDDFERDIIGALRDLAGVSVAGSRKSKLIASEKFVTECFDSTKLDPVTLPTIVIGLKDAVELIWYIDVAKVRLDKSVQRYMHLDIAFTGDALGLSMCGVSGYKEVEVEKLDGTFSKQRLPVIETDFVLRIKAREGDRIPLHKVRKVVLDLRALGYAIKFSADLRLASEDTAQLLSGAGIEVRYLSVDRTDRAYVNWRNLIYEKRWVMHPHARVLFEAKNLEHDVVRGKVDHPAEVRDVEVLDSGEIKEVVLSGTKDCTDAIVGGIQNCLEDLGVPLDVQGMKQLLGKVADSLKEDDIPVLKMMDSEGKEIVGVQSGDTMKRLSDIMKKLR